MIYRESHQEVLRDYRPGDAEAMHELDVICFEPVFRFSRRTMRKLAEARGAITLLAEAEERLVGFTIVHVQDEWGYIVTLDVDPAWRRRGVAKRLMTEVEARARGAGASAMALHVFRENTGAIRFYEKSGYNRMGIDENFYARGLHALVYRKRLASET